MPLQTAQWMYNGMGLLTTAVIDLEPGVDHKEVKEALQPMMGEELEYWNGRSFFQSSFKPLRPIWQEVKSSSLSCIYHLFRVARDRHMMVSEREREFGILVSIGCENQSWPL